MIDENYFNITYNINAGEKYFFNELKLEIPTDYRLENFSNITSKLDEYKNTAYSSNKINKLLNEIDKIAETKQFEFINATFKEKSSK